MTATHAAAVFTLACALAASPRPAPAAPAPAGASAPAAPPAEAAPELPLTGLTAEQQQNLTAWSKTAFCYCGCPHTVEQCMREHRTCKHAPRMAAYAARLLRAGAKKDELAATARGLGADGEALRAALESGKYVAKVRESQAEARAARITGTPSLFLDGRALTDLSEEGLDFTLEDEEEWIERGGWTKD